MAYNKLKGLLVERGIDNGEMAKILKINRATFNQKLNNRLGADFTCSQMRTICRHLNISADIYFLHEGRENTT